MMSLRLLLVNLLTLHAIFSEHHSACCLDAVWQRATPSISRLQNISDKQSLKVSWLVNHTGLVADIYEIQIGRTENHIIIYKTKVRLFAVDSDEYTWTWTSDLPLECVDHSVRIRCFYNTSAPSPWSDWATNYGVKASNKAKIFPVHRVLREGSSAMFCCVPPRGVGITSFTFNDSKFPLISIGATVMAITVDSLTIPKSVIKFLSLNCSDTRGLHSSVWNYVSFPPQKPRNLSCVTQDMTTVTCTWDSGRKQYLHDRNKRTQTLHIENSDEAPITCEQASCTFLAIPQLEVYNISLVVKDMLGEETESYSFNISERVSPVLKRDKVSLGVTDTNVSWIVQANLTQKNLLCQVNIDSVRTTELSCNSASGLCKVRLENLLPYTDYSTRARCSADGRLWGEWTQPVSFKTYPLVTLDVWRRINQLSDPNSRQVTLLWTPHVPATVNIQGYVVQWSQEGRNWTETKDSGQTQAEVSIGPGRCDFTVQAFLHNMSPVHAHITIPQRDDGENLPAEKLLSTSMTAGFNLSWDEQDTATCGYTVEWCTLGNAGPCTLRWMKVPEGNTLSLPARYFKAGCRFTFNIYKCTEHGHRLLEIQTGYSQELKSVESPTLVEPVQYTSSSVTLVWLYNEEDRAHPAFITGYLVMVHQVGSDKLPGHAANLSDVTMWVEDPKRKSVTIYCLEPNQEYAFSVSALTKEGPGQQTSIIIRTKANYSGDLAKILTPIVFLLGCIILLWPLRKMLTRQLKYIFVYPAGMNIRPPELDNFLDEAERLQSQEEECRTCDIEILNTRPPPNETNTLRDPEPLNTLPSLGPPAFPSILSLSISPVQLQADYCPQSVSMLWDGPAVHQISVITNKTYFHMMGGDFSEAPQVIFNEVNEPSESPHESCSVVYGYISKDTL